jgi:hypothetical protein
MYSGNIIDELIAAVERAEGRFEIRQKQDREQDSYLLPYETTTNTELTLAGVA